MELSKCKEVLVYMRECNTCKVDDTRNQHPYVRDRGNRQILCLWLGGLNIYCSLGQQWAGNFSSTHILMFSTLVMHSETTRLTATTSQCLATCNCPNGFVWLCCVRLCKILYMVIITPVTPCECGCDPPNFGSKILTQHRWPQLDKRKII